MAVTTREHCWHPGAGTYDICCFCGEIRQRKQVPPPGHGKYAPPGCLDVEFVGGQRPCVEHEPPPKKDTVPF